MRFRPCNPMLLLVSVLMGVGFGQEVPPPTVRDDGRVTFRRLAREADTVVLAIEGRKSITMSQDENGVWTATTDPLPPDIYAYHFLVDGVPADDPTNDNRLPLITGGAQGLVQIPGKDGMAWERGDEPQGRVESLDYESKIIGEPRRLMVYLPPHYDRRANYPVLYLLHGVLGDERSWTAAGRVHVMLDNLLESGIVRPMIVVMPQGYGFTDAKHRVNQLFGPMNHKEWMERFAKSLLTEIIPAVESRYAVQSERKGRAIAGLSMGGAQALFIGLNHPDSFCHIGCLSSAFTLYGGRPEAFLDRATQTPADQRPALWISVGTDDFVLFTNRQIVAWLEKQGIDLEFKQTPGGHTWGVWRRSLIDFAPRLFRQQQDNGRPRQLVPRQPVGAPNGID